MKRASEALKVRASHLYCLKKRRTKTALLTWFVLLSLWSRFSEFLPCSRSADKLAPEASEVEPLPLAMGGH